MKSSAKVVIVGAGVVGASAAYHLAHLGWTDLCVVDQGPIPRTGGSSSHAPGLLFQTNPSKTMTELAANTAALYSSLDVDGEPCYYPVGSIEVSTTPQRQRELARRRGFARAWGLDAELISPDDVARHVPLVDPERILGGLHVGGDGIAKGVRGVEAMLRAAAGRGAHLLPGTEVTGFDVDGGRVRAVETTAGRIACAYVLICAGIWGPKVGRLAGVSIPVQPLAHQYARTAPLPSLRGAPGTDVEISHPLLRNQDAAMYFRQLGEAYGVGSYQHRTMPLDAGAIPSIADARAGRAGARAEGGLWGGQPSVQAFTEEDFKQPWQDACDLLPALREAEVAEGMNGLFLFTPDGMPVLGESREVRGLWVAEAVWVTHSGGVGRAVAEWMVEGRPGLDLRQADANRFVELAHSPAYVRARGEQNYREVYDVIHPLQPMEQPRPLRTSPFYPRQVELGAFFLEALGWERPHWYEHNRALLDGLAVPGRDDWSARFWSPVAAAEHLAARERVAMVDMTSLYTIEVTGPGAPGFLQWLTTNDVSRPPGAVSYTLMLDQRGGIRSDLTVARLGEEEFQVGANGPLDLDWMLRHAPGDGSVVIREVTAARCCIGLWGPRARAVLEQLTADDVSHEGFRFFRARRIFVGEVPVTALRLSYVGELGWELYTSNEYGLRLWDLLWEAGQPFGAVPVGRSAFNSLRLEKGYRAWGTDMWTDHRPVEAGLDFAVRMDKDDFLGRDALAAAAGRPRHTLACLLLDDPARLVMGSEPVHRGGEVVGFTTSAAHAYSTGESVAYAWLPPDLAVEGTRLEVAYLGERYPARVASEPRLDPPMRRMRC